MSNVSSFLPPHLLRSLASAATRPLPFARRYEAALLFSDISGFTALTERLQARGREGAEEIASVVSSAFDPTIRIIERWGGSIVAFGGDALFTLFPGASAVGRCVAAANAIRDLFARTPEVQTSAGPSVLRISQAVHFGEVWEIHLGTMERRHCLFGGGAVAALARLESQSVAGQVLLSRTARARMTEEPRPRARAAPRPRALADGSVECYLPPCFPALLQRFEGQYRSAAVLFLETPRSPKLGARQLAAVQRFYLSLSRVLDTYEGLLLKSDLSSTGTKWLCVFGIPAAHEDDVERAARAALELRAEEAAGVTFRGGMHAGTLVNVVVGTGSRRSFDIMGDVVNTAARALVKGQWGEVLASETSRRALTAVETAERGRHAVKGKSEPLELHALVRAIARTRAVRVGSPMLGRNVELGMLRERLQHAKEGHGSAVGIRGDVGIGKSRLVWETAAIARDLGFEVYEGQALSFGGSAYAAVSALLRRTLGISEGAGVEDVLACVEREASRLGLSGTDRHHLAEVMGARHEASPLVHLDGKVIRLNNALAVRAYLHLRAREAPLLLILEDMHWADEMTSEAVSHIAKGLQGASIVLLLPHRPGYEMPSEVGLIALRELVPEAVNEMLANLLGLGPRVPPEGLSRLVHERAEGNPFYVEETVRHLLETGVLVPDATVERAYRLLREPESHDLPDTIESVIAARLDRLDPGAKRAAQIAAVIGRTFQERLLASFEDIGPGARVVIDDLLARDIVVEVELVPDRRLAFKYALTRDVAYGMILKQRRKELHQRVAQSIEELYPVEREASPAVLGYHWAQAGLADKARAYYLAGARRAAGRFSRQEAERLYRAYFDLQDRPTGESVKARNELADIVASQRARSSEALEERRRAVEESRELLDVPQEIDGLQGMATISMITGKMAEARQLHEQALATARAHGLRREEALALGNLASLEQAQGHMSEARKSYEEAIAICRDLGVRRFEGAITGNLANLNQEQGRLEEARALYEKAIAIAREVGNRQAEGAFLGNLGLHQQGLGQRDDARKSFEEAIAILAEIGDRRFAGIIQGTLAALRYEEGESEQARSLYEQALSAVRDFGDKRTEAYLLTFLGGFERLASEDLSVSEGLLHQAEGLLSQLGDKVLLGLCLCQAGHLALAGGQAQRALRRAEELARSVHAGPDSPLGKAIESLERAIDDAAAGRPLLRGQRAEDVPEGLRRKFPSASGTP